MSESHYIRFITEEAERLKLIFGEENVADKGYVMIDVDVNGYTGNLESLDERMNETLEVLPGQRETVTYFSSKTGIGSYSYSLSETWRLNIIFDIKKLDKENYSKSLVKVFDIVLM
jgi:hypothetical protein